MKNKKTDIQLEKNKIRQKILEKRNNLSTEEVEKKSDLIIENLGKFILRKVFLSPKLQIVKIEK